MANKKYYFFIGKTIHFHKLYQGKTAVTVYGVMQNSTKFQTIRVSKILSQAKQGKLENQSVILLQRQKMSEYRL